ncbi:MAG: hypothetical protein E7521_05455 [Ruminococcaceae bacterium]|nr:hypothetical protein [Oscillospiraceae bacterium]
MKKCMSVLLAVCLLVSCVLVGAPVVHAAKKEAPKRAIAIVFDNSGSMYLDKKQDWCRATYAMEVFASMLNKGDTLTIYPMWPIEVEGKTYTMDSPFQITDASQSVKIREIYSPEAKGTPIDTIDCASNGLKAATADEKYMIVLTDGDSFYLNGADLKGKTKGELDKRFKALAGPDMTVMYLGVGKQTVMPDTAESDYFVKKHAKDSANVLSSLTEMCNKIFGRDSLPQKRINGNTIDFDISMSKVIVFVQGENIADLKVTGAKGEMGTKAGSTATKYSTKGTGRCESVPDTSLQGMMVTYTDCASGQYTINHSGKATSIEVYYEPDADLDFVFTDADDNDVDPKELYEGDYKVAFGMKDAKTGQLIESDLLGKPKYEGSYFINGEEHKINAEGFSGEVPISLKMDDTFEAKLTATYLSDYTISKDSTDFGWPEGGIKVAAMPAGLLKLEITGGERVYSLQTLEQGQPYIAKVYYQGAQLTGKELEKVKLSWDDNTTHAKIESTFKDDHYELKLGYKNPESKKDTVCGKCKVAINAAYAAPGSDEATAKRTLTYHIDSDEATFKMDLTAQQDYIVIKELDSSEPIIAKLKVNGNPLTPEEFARVKLEVKCDKIKYTLTPNESDSSYSIKLGATKGIAEGKYPIEVKAIYTDAVGRPSEVNGGVVVTLSNTPLWLKWLIVISLLIILFVIIWMILHIRVLPKKIKPIDASMNFYGEDVTQDTKFNINASRGTRTGTMTVSSEYGGTKASVTMVIKPGKESYLYKPQKKRSIEVVKDSVRKIGLATVQNADIGTTGYVFDEDKDNLIPAMESNNNFVLRQGNEISFSGLMPDELTGRDRDFSTSIKLNFVKR